MAVFSGNGSATAPSFTFSSDTNLGIFRGGTDIISFTTAGTERSRLDASGNFEIGGTLGSDPNISLDSDGSGTFGSPTNGSAGSGIYISGTTDGAPGSIEFDSDSDTGGDASRSNCFLTGYSGSGVKTNKFYVGRDGSAAFAGDIGIGGTLPASPNISLNADGSAEFAGTVQTDGAFQGNLSGPYLPIGTLSNAALLRGDQVIFSSQDGSDHYGHFDTAGALRIGGDSTGNNAVINADGSAEFAGNVTTDLSFIGAGASIQNASASTIFLAGNGSQNLFSIDNTGTTKIGGVLPGSPNISLNEDGSADFSSFVIATVDEDYGIISARKDGTTGSKTAIYLAPANNVVGAGITSTAENDFLSNPNRVASLGLISRNGELEPTEKARLTPTGDFEVGGTLGTAPNISLNANGDITCNNITAGDINDAAVLTDVNYGIITIRNDYGSGTGSDYGKGQAFRVYAPGAGNAPNQANITTEIRGDGNVRFYSGEVGIGGSNPAAGGTVTAPTITLNPNGTASKTGGGSWSSTSDERAKEEIVDYTSGLEEVNQLLPRSYRFIGNDKTYVGLVAQETEGVMPEMVSQGKGLLPDGTEVDDFRTLDSTALTFALVNAVKELSAEVNSLKARLDAAGI